MTMISMSIVPPLTTARINPTVSLDDKPIESDSTNPVVRVYEVEGGRREREREKLVERKAH